MKITIQLSPRGKMKNTSKRILRKITSNLLKINAIDVKINFNGKSTNKIQNTSRI